MEFRPIDWRCGVVMEDLGPIHITQCPDPGGREGSDSRENNSTNGNISFCS